MQTVRIAELNFGSARRNPNAQTRGWTVPELTAGCNDDVNPVIEGF
jgi:acetyl-CoA C-acetyltransferase